MEELQPSRRTGQRKWHGHRHQQGPGDHFRGGPERTFHPADNIDYCKQCHTTISEFEDIRLGSDLDYNMNGDAEEPLKDELQSIAADLLERMRVAARNNEAPICYDGHGYSSSGRTLRPGARGARFAGPLFRGQALSENSPGFERQSSRVDCAAPTKRQRRGFSVSDTAIVGAACYARTRSLSVRR